MAALFTLTLLFPVSAPFSTWRVGSWSGLVGNGLGEFLAFLFTVKDFSILMMCWVRGVCGVGLGRVVLSYWVLVLGIGVVLIHTYIHTCMHTYIVLV